MNIFYQQLAAIRKSHRTSFLYVYILIFYYAAEASIARHQLTESILHYEPLNQRHHLQSRVRKSLDSKDHNLYLHFKAHGRTFNIILKRDISLFTHNLHIEQGEKSHFHPSNIYEGYIKNEPSSSVHGFIYDGIFEGRINTEDGNEYHIESAKLYKHLDSEKVHSVIYNIKDINYKGSYQRAGKRANEGDIDYNRTIMWNDYDSPNILFTPDHKVIHNRQRRAAPVQKKTECHLFIRADPTYAKYANNDYIRAMYMMSQHVKTVSNIFKGTTFSGNAESYTLHIKRIGVIDTSKCNKMNDKTVTCLFKPDNIGVEKFLDIASLEDHDSYCLSYVFSHRDFSDGVLGLAWIGDVNGAGGICDRFQSIGGVKKSLNTGIVSNLNYGKTVPSKVTDVTLAHEIGHNFGSQHDPLSGNCAPGGADGGNYVMYPRATSGSETNNKKFSPCSKGSMWKVLKAKAPQCFKKTGEPICGNQNVEGNEKCDCGYHQGPRCNSDPCCVGASIDGSSRGVKGCTYTLKATAVEESKRCSPSEGFCCNPDQCKPYANSTKTCSKAGDCIKASVCVEHSHKCPKPVVKKPEKNASIIVCNNGANTCVNGECSGSLCLAEKGKVDCQCKEKKSYCKVCCRDKNTKNANCTLYHDSINGETAMRPAGSPCDQYEGYCDILSMCRKVDAEGPLSRLKKWILNKKTFATILDWMKSHWWACVLIGLGLVLFMAGFIACCSVHTPSSNPSKPQARTLTLRRSRPRNARPTAPTPSTSSGGYPPQDEPPGYDTAVRESRRPYPAGFEMR